MEDDDDARRLAACGKTSWRSEKVSRLNRTMSCPGDHCLFQVGADGEDTGRVRGGGGTAAEKGN